jgi:hypothetical protein
MVPIYAARAEDLTHYQTVTALCEARGNGAAV